MRDKEGVQCEGVHNVEPEAFAGVDIDTRGSGHCIDETEWGHEEDCKEHQEESDSNCSIAPPSFVTASHLGELFGFAEEDNVQDER